MSTELNALKSIAALSTDEGARNVAREALAEIESLASPVQEGEAVEHQVGDFEEWRIKKGWAGVLLNEGLLFWQDDDDNKKTFKQLYSLFKQRPIVKEDTQDELFDELVTKLHNSYNEVELALLKTQYKIIRKWASGK